MMDILLNLACLATGGAIGLLWKYRQYHALQDRLARLTDRDEKGRFVRRER